MFHYGRHENGGKANEIIYFQICFPFLIRGTNGGGGSSSWTSFDLELFFSTSQAIDVRNCFQNLQSLQVS